MCRSHLQKCGYRISMPFLWSKSVRGKNKGRKDRATEISARLSRSPTRNVWSLRWRSRCRNTPGVRSNTIFADPSAFDNFNASAFVHKLRLLNVSTATGMSIVDAHISIHWSIDAFSLSPYASSRDFHKNLVGFVDFCTKPHRDMRHCVTYLWTAPDVKQITFSSSVTNATTLARGLWFVR